MSLVFCSTITVNLTDHFHKYLITDSKINKNLINTVTRCTLLRLLYYGNYILVLPGNAKNAFQYKSY